MNNKKVLQLYRKFRLPENEEVGLKFLTEDVLEGGYRSFALLRMTRRGKLDKKRNFSTELHGYHPDYQGV